MGAVASENLSWEVGLLSWLQSKLEVSRLLCNQLNKPTNSTNFPTRFTLSAVFMFADFKGSPLAAILVAFVVTFLLTPLVARWATRAGALSFPGGRRTHPQPMPQWGGLAIFLGVLAAALVWKQPTTDDLRLLAPSSNPEVIAQTAQTVRLSVSFFGCGALMLLLGMWDDKRELSPLGKFGGQAIIASVLWVSGVQITTLPFTDGLQQLSAFSSWILTLVWVLAVTNGINFIDGVDGLATGVCAIAAGSLCLMQAEKAQWAAAASAAICGACIGFLRFNFHPAKIFLGDAGALLLGFWLATIGLAAAAKTAAATTLALPLLVLGIPILDLSWAVVRRTLAKQPPWRGDRGHLHHRLLGRGLSPVKTVLILYGIAAFLGVAAYFWGRN